MKRCWFLALALCAISLAPAVAQEPKEIKKTNKAVELTKNPTPDAYRDFSAKTGENIPPHRLESWRWFKANPLTPKEWKTRPSEMFTAYHGGWDRGVAYPWKDGSFHLQNEFGVWKYNEEKDQLVFQFSWPQGIDCRYDEANHCYWGYSTGGNMHFDLTEGGQPANPQQYYSRSGINLSDFQWSDAAGHPWTHNYWLARKEDRLFLHSIFYCSFPFNMETDLTWVEAQRKAEVVYRRHGYFRANDGAVQKHDGKKWVEARPPKGIDDRAYCVDQDGPQVLIANYQGAYEWHTTYGVALQLADKKTRWIALDRQSRIWLAPGYCLDDRGHATTFMQFSAALPKLLAEDPVVASKAMRTLLRAGDNYLPWL